MCYTIDDYKWRSIMVEYDGVNHWRIYNPKKKKIHIWAFVWFDEGLGYYDTSHEVTNEDDIGDKLGDV